MAAKKLYSNFVKKNKKKPGDFTGKMAKPVKLGGRAVTGSDDRSYLQRAKRNTV